SRRERHFPGSGLLTRADDLPHLLAHRVPLDADPREHPLRDALVLAKQPEEQVLGADVVVLQAAGLVLREDDHLPRALGEAFEHMPTVASGGCRRSAEPSPGTPTPSSAC